MFRGAIRFRSANFILAILTFAMISVSRAFRSGSLSNSPILHRFGSRIFSRGNKPSSTFKGNSASEKDTNNVDVGIHAHFPASKSTSTGKQYDFTHELLPEETMYIFDGTAMLFASHFTSATVQKQLNGGDDNNSTAVVQAVLGQHLNAKIVANMSDDQIRDMLTAFDKMDRPNLPSLSVGDNNTISDAVITAETRAALQLRCDPLVALLWQFARLVRDIKPKYVAVAFDAGRHTFRKDLYPAYKLQRSEVAITFY